MKEIDPGKEKGYEVKKVFPLERVDISEPVMGLLEQYGRSVNQERTVVEGAKQVAAVVRDFVGGDAPEWIVDAAALAMMAEQASKDETKVRDGNEKNRIVQARRYIHRYMLMSTPEAEPGCVVRSDEIVKTLASLSYIESELGNMHSVKRGLGQATGLPADERLRVNPHQGRSDKKDDVDEPWDGDLEDVTMAEPEKLLSLTNQKMFVPILIKAAMTLDKLSNRGDISKEAAKRYASDALKVYAPFCEIIGYDGEALALNNDSMGVKFENSVHYTRNRALVDRMKAEHERIFKGSGKFRAIARLFDRDSLEVSPVVNSKSKSHKVKLGTFKATLGGMEIDGRYRVKSVFSMLNKIFNKQKAADSGEDVEMPMDLLGLTCITENKEESARLIRKVYEQIALDDNLRFKPERKRAKYEEGYIHVQGTSDYVETICSSAGFDINKVSHRELQPEDYEVAKLTFEVKSGDDWIPTELQILTKDAREEARVGVASHLLYKLFGYLENDDDDTKTKRRKSSGILRAIKAQKQQMKSAMTPLPHMFEFIDLCQSAGV